jgi:hypothetical protein
LILFIATLPTQKYKNPEQLRRRSGRTPENYLDRTQTEKLLKISLTWISLFQINFPGWILWIPERMRAAAFQLVTMYYVYLFFFLIKNDSQKTRVYLQFSQSDMTDRVVNFSEE